MSDFAALWTEAYQAPLSAGFSRQEYGGGLPFPPLGDLHNPGIEPTALTSPALVGRVLTISVIWKAQSCIGMYIYYDEPTNTGTLLLTKFCNLFGSPCTQSLLSVLDHIQHTTLHLVSLTTFMKLFSCSGMSESLRHHTLHQSRLHWASTSPGAFSTSCPLSQ